MSIAQLFRQTAERHPTCVALRDGDTTLSYGSLADASDDRMADLLQTRGVSPGDRFEVMVPNGPEFATLYYGILRAGGVAVVVVVVVPMNPLIEEHRVEL